MTPLIEDRLTFTMPLTLKAHQIANQFRAQQSCLRKAKQVYLNTLAVQTVATYLNWLRIDAELTASDSWSLAMQTLADTADLVITGKGKLECRWVLSGETVCYIPPEVWLDRIAYVVVQFDRALSESSLLGFVPQVTSLELPLNQLRSLDELLITLGSSTSVAPITAPIPLSRWLQEAMDAGWQTVEELFGLQQPTWSMRHSQVQAAEAPTMRGKILSLEVDPNYGPIALLVGIVPSPTLPVNIWVKVCPANYQRCLPETLEVMVLDEVGVAVMQAQSRSTEMIQLKFSGVPGEVFSIRVVLGAQSAVESFVI